jgi:hypothetical protein
MVTDAGASVMASATPAPRENDRRPQPVTAAFVLNRLKRGFSRSADHPRGNLRSDAVRAPAFQCRDGGRGRLAAVCRSRRVCYTDGGARVAREAGGGARQPG